MLLLIYLFFTNLILGLTLYKVYFRTKTKVFLRSNFLIFAIGFITTLKGNSSPFFNFIFCCTPLFICFLRFVFEQLKTRKQMEKEAQTRIVFLELVLLKMKMGSSFKDSVLKSQTELKEELLPKKFFQKNVVTQQPKSRYSFFFSELSHDLEKIKRKNIHQKDLIFSLKEQYKRRHLFHQKIQSASAQYKIQSSVLFLFWLLSLLMLLLQGLAQTYLQVIVLSFFLMLLGLLLSKKMLTQSEIQI